MNKKCLVIFSGGQDSTTCLFWAIEKFGIENTKTLTFDYGQRHHIELCAAEKIAKIAGVAFFRMKLSGLAQLEGNSLTDSSVVVDNHLDSSSQLANTFVPGRNIVFLTYAAAYAYTQQISNLIIGVAQIDYSGYPDCRRKTIDAMENTLNLAMETSFKLHTPLMDLSKQETVELAKSLGAMKALAYSHTCYNGLFPPCGQCNACIIRAEGFRQAGVIDPLHERV